MSGAMSWPFLRLYLLALLYFSANSILNVIIPLRGESAGASGTTIGLIMGAYMIASMCFRPWAGAIVEKYGPIKVLRFILIMNGCALILYTITGLEGYFAARMLQGVCTAFFSMALHIGIIDALPEKERSRGISFYSLFTYIPGMIGPLLALGLWQSGSMDAFTITMVAIAVFTGLFGYTVKLDQSANIAAANGDRTEHRMNTLGSLSQLVKNRDLFRCSVLMVAASIVFGAITAFMPLYAAQLKSGNAGVYLMLQAGAVVFARYAFSKRIPSDGRWHSLFIMGTMCLIAVAALCVSASLWWGAIPFYAGALLMGLGQALLYPTLTTYLSFVLPQTNRNVLIGLFIAMTDLGVSLGGIIMGPVADVSSYSFMYMVCAVLAAATVVIAFRNYHTNFEGGTL